MNDKVLIRRLSSGVPGLDEVLGGGIPEYSFNLVSGGPGCGKTTLAHQIMFANAQPERPALYLSILGEPPIKMLRYQQQFSFFDISKVNGSVRFVHLGQEALDGGLDRVLARIAEEVQKTDPSIVVVDSFRAVVRGSAGRPESELYQAIDRNSVVRKLQVVKMRGQGQIPGLHTVRIAEGGLLVFPRLPMPEERQVAEKPQQARLSTGVEALDQMMGGGIPSGYTVLVAGPSGSGKTVLSNQFLIEGARQGQPGILAIFEKRPSEYLKTTPHGEEFARLVQQSKLEVLYLRPLDLSIDETLLALREAVLRTGAKRAVIDSLSGLELALAPTFRVDFRESLYRMFGALTVMGVTVLSTAELSDSYTELSFSPQAVSFLTDAVIIQRYVQIEGRLDRLMAVVKVRASQHSKDLRSYHITEDGLIVMGSALCDYEGLLTGRPHRVVPVRPMGSPRITE
jgi:circadian clock protein KaiC